ncbi:MAG TPA: iron permease [Cryomorphaceae bacterium]|nr:iron permease [Cryomorphaceae bacterium]
MFTLTATAKSEQARMMVHLLDYIAVDYSMAVQNGQIISQAEFQEMNEFAATIIELGEKTPPSIQSDLILLQRLVQDKASIDKVSSVSNNIKQEIISYYKLEIAPKRWPSLASGQKLFALHCQSCHGAQGKGDGPLSQGLEPAPTNFHDPEKANGLSPFQAYNTIRLGVENTGMRAFNELNDDEVWDLAFYVMSLPHQGKDVDPALVKNNIKGELNLEMLASLNNKELADKLELDPAYPSIIPSLRLYPSELAEESEGDYLDKAKRLIRSSAAAYSYGRHEEARTLALTAYLEGVEPVEVQLRANDASFVAPLEGQLAEMRSAIEGKEAVETIKTLADNNIKLLTEAQVILSERSFSGWIAFLLSSSIILREGLEAFLVIITILGIIRALKLKNAASWVHAGWVTAIFSGFLLWLIADRFFTFSGAQREIMEGAIALFAVGVLLYVGFWMHSKSEAGKWQAYVKNKIQGLAKKENMLGLALLSFLVVFREAFESVLFLSALSLEIGESHQMAFGGGIIFAFLALFVISVLLLKYSRKLPITKLFRYSSMIISFLAVVLVGKGIHAIQEAGTISISTMPVNLRLDWIGLYPTWETFLAQMAILILIVFLWNIGNKSQAKATATAHQSH